MDSGEELKKVSAALVVQVTPQELIVTFETLAEAPEGSSDFGSWAPAACGAGSWFLRIPRMNRRKCSCRRLARDKVEFFERIGARLREATVIRHTPEPVGTLAGWSWVRMGDLADPQAGFAFKSESFNDNGDGVPLVRIRTSFRHQPDDP